MSLTPAPPPTYAILPGLLGVTVGIAIDGAAAWRDQSTPATLPATVVGFCAATEVDRPRYPPRQIPPIAGDLIRCTVDYVCWDRHACDAHVDALVCVLRAGPDRGRLVKVALELIVVDVDGLIS